MKIPLVDSHVHLWQPGGLEYPWLTSVPALNRSFLPADFAAATKNTEVRKIIFVEAGAAPAHNRDEVKWVTELAKQEPKLKGIVANASLERGAGVKEEVDVRVDEAGEEGAIAEVDDFGVGRAFEVRAYVGDAVVLDEDFARGEISTGVDLQEAGGVQEDGVGLG